MASLPMNYPWYYIHILQFNVSVTLVMVMNMVMITSITSITELQLLLKINCQVDSGGSKCFSNPTLE